MGEVRDLSSARSARANASAHEVTLRAERHAPRIARQWVMRAAASAGIGGTLNQVIEVLTSELVSDAVRVCAAEGEVRVCLRVDATAARVSVTGPSPRVSTDVGSASLALVEVLSTSWGTWPPTGGERTVWFDVETAG